MQLLNPCASRRPRADGVGCAAGSRICLSLYLLASFSGLLGHLGGASGTSRMSLSRRSFCLPLRCSAHASLTHKSDKVIEGRSSLVGAVGRARGAASGNDTRGAAEGGRLRTTRAGRATADAFWMLELGFKSMVAAGAPVGSSTACLASLDRHRGILRIHGGPLESRAWCVQVLCQLSEVAPRKRPLHFGIPRDSTPPCGL